MKWLIVLTIFLNSAFAADSVLIPIFLEASDVYVQQKEGLITSQVLRPDLKAVIEVLDKNNIHPGSLRKYVQEFAFNRNWVLPADGHDDLIESFPHSNTVMDVPEVSIHATKVKVIKGSDRMFKDDIYGYFFVTDGVIPVGRVTSIYKGLSTGQSFFFNHEDRVLFPQGIPAKRPDAHLIVDFGLIESDGDDIKEMQKLTSIIIDIAIAVYSTHNPQAGQVIANLRKEVKALADLLLGLNNDDRLVADSFAFTTAEITELLSERSYLELTKNYKDEKGKWEYEISFRMLRR